MVYIFQWTKALGIRSFSSSLVPLFQNESSSKTFLINTSLIWMKMNRSTFSNATRFDTEAKVIQKWPTVGVFLNKEVLRKILVSQTELSFDQVYLVTYTSDSGVILSSSGNLCSRSRLALSFPILIISCDR